MNEEVLAALATAKWNESVMVHLQEEEEENDKERKSGGGEEAASTTLLLVPRIDKDHGGIRWENATASVSNSSLLAAHHLSTKKWIFPMLHDQRRNELYERAIKKASTEAIQRFLHDASQQPSNIATTGTLSALDIGSGSGLLALLAQKHLSNALGAPPNKQPPKIEITSLEMAAPMAYLARKTVQLAQAQRQSTRTTNNSLVDDPIPSSTIEIREAHSSQIPALKSDNGSASAGYYLCTSELLESGLLGEGWLPAMRDAWDRHLHPNAVVVPQKARVYAQAVFGVSNFAGPVASFPVGNGGLPLRLVTADHPNPGYLSDGSYDSGTGHKCGIHVEIHADQYLKNIGDGTPPVLTVLSGPITALSVDVTSPSTLKASLSSTRTSFVATAAGRVEGILFWWELDLYGGNDDEDDLTYSTAPNNCNRFQDHWHQNLYVFPPDGDDSSVIELTMGTTYTLLASHDDTRVHFSIENDGSDPPGKVDQESKRVKLTIPTSVTPVAGPFRCWQLNDTVRSKVLMDGIQYALETLQREATTNNSTIVLDLSDFSLCGMLASLLGAPNVLSIESSSGELPMASARVAQIGNCLPLDEKTTKFQILRCHAESLTNEILRGEITDGDNGEELSSSPAVVDLVVGEPYYEILEGWPIETALNYFYTVRMLKRKGIVRTSLCVPAQAVVLACGIESWDLYSAYRKELSATSSTALHVCGFDHTPLVECWRYDKKGISVSLWEYGDVVPVTEIVQLARLDYENGTIIQEGKGDDSEKSVVLMAPFIESKRTCHAIAIWVDYQIRNAPSSSNSGSSDAFATLSTGIFGKASMTRTSKISERQTVTILAQAKPTVLGESLAIPKNNFLELS